MKNCLFFLRISLNFNAGVSFQEIETAHKICFVHEQKLWPRPTTKMKRKLKNENEIESNEMYE